MRFFLKELKNDWEPLKWEGYNSYLIKEQIKTGVRVFNREIVSLLMNFKTNIVFSLSAILLIILAVMISRIATDSYLNDLFAVITNALFGLLTIFITAAIFMATISNQVLTKSSDILADYLALLHATDGFFKDVYTALPTETTVDQRYRVVSAVASESVLDQPSYIEFRDWLESIKDDFNGTDYEDQFKYPYDLAQAHIDGKAWAIKDGIELLEHELPKTDLIKKIIEKNKSSISTLKAGSVDYQISGASAVYEQREFLGPMLTKTLAYGIAAILLVYVFRLVAEHNYNFIAEYDLRSILILKFLAVLVLLSALVYALRFLFHLAAYFRRVSVNYGESTTVNIYPETESECRNNYGYMGGCELGR